MKYRNIIILLLLSVLPMLAIGKAVKQNGVTVTYEDNGDNTVTVIQVENGTDQPIELYIDGNPIGTIAAHSQMSVNTIGEKRVTVNSGQSNMVFWTKPRNVAPAHSTVSSESDEYSTHDDVSSTPAQRTPAKRPETNRPSSRPENKPSKAARNADKNMLEMLENDPFFGKTPTMEYCNMVYDHIDALEVAEDPQAYIEQNGLNKLLAESEVEIAVMEKQINQNSMRYVQTLNINDTEKRNDIMSVMNDLQQERANQRSEANAALKEAIDKATKPNILSDKELISYIVIGVVCLIIILLIILVVKKKSHKKAHHQSSTASYKPATTTTESDGDGNVVVRRRTTSILKRQNIDDVINNPAYLKIDTADFTSDSSVKRIFIKNSAIKAVYNLYAEDLRNVDKPKEDGCMVLGRWVLDKNTGKYDVTLEEVVMPGDDAVFREYELNFGGKIRMKVAEKLRKLRRDTGLQYDLTCWIHSHPGLGVFFSNSDCQVQDQLKHVQHPNFLTAFVVDILTDNQDMGIFTYRPDGSIISANDLRKQYSLESLYKWAASSERQSFVPDNYYNLLANVGLKAAACNAIYLNNNAIIDLARLAVEGPQNGLVGWALGDVEDRDNHRDYVVTGVCPINQRPNARILGCMVTMPHLSMPSIQRIIANEQVALNFVLAYSSKEGTVTVIPVLNGEIVNDQRFYVENNLNDLNIWTRRRR